MTGVNNNFVRHGNTPWQNLSVYYMRDSADGFRMKQLFLLAAFRSLAETAVLLVKIIKWINYINFTNNKKCAILVLTNV